MVSRGFGNLLLAISVDGHQPWTCWHVSQRCWPYCGPQIASAAAAVTHPVHPEQMVCIPPFPDGGSLMQSLGWLGVCGWGVGTMGGGDHTGQGDWITLLREMGVRQLYS